MTLVLVLRLVSDGRLAAAPRDRRGADLSALQRSSRLNLRHDRPLGFRWWRRSTLQFEIFIGLFHWVTIT